MEFRVLGPVELRVENQTVDLGPARQRSVLAALLVEPERPTTIESLIDRVWGDTPPTGVRSVVYTYVTRLRRVLAEATNATDTPVTVHRNAVGYMLGIRPDLVDLASFRDTVARARALNADDPRRVELLGQALRLWRGEALAGLNGDWAQRVRGTLLQLKHEVLAEWVDAEVRAGRGLSGLAVLRQALLEEPLAEPLHERLIRILYANGQVAEALKQYERVRHLIADELGADPGSGLRELHRQILQGRPLGMAHERWGTAPVPSLRTVGPRVPAALAPVPAVSSVRPVPVVPVPDDHGDDDHKGTSPDLLPMDLADFGGRDSELAWLRSAVTSPAAGLPPTVVITGGVGVGKTSLAIRAAHSLREDFPDGRLYVNLRGTCDRPATSGAVLTRLLRALGFRPAWIPADLDERAELYRNWMSGRRVLLVLDDAASEEQIEPLLPGGHACRVLVTSRVPLGTQAGARLRVLHELSQEQSLELLVRIAGRERMRDEPEAAAQLARYCGGLPLVLRAVAYRLVSRPHWTLAELLVRIADEERRLDELAYGSLDLRTSLESTYNRLDTTACRLFQHLGETAHTGMDLRVAPALGLPPAKAQDAFETLVGMHLIYVEGRDPAGRIRYRMNDLLRLYARSAARSSHLATRLPAA
ncbi:BTAD domain-containing putative transcriptional regulator [Streptomyces sp. NPDC093109]|uniref:AfsR/SARP family transcriptional regulator n=1 Tax=Streptomyces sp. NPDC093109 TaxID=3154977 RepID=UPI00344F8692